jgi:hypothetical protein
MLNKEDKEYFSNMGYDVKSIEIGVAYALGAKVQNKIPALLRVGNETSKGQVMPVVPVSKNKEVDLSLVFTQAELQSMKKFFSESIARLEVYRSNYKRLYNKVKLQRNAAGLKEKFYQDMQWTSRKIKRLAKLQTKLKKV